jgi:hypothetical protein
MSPEERSFSVRFITASTSKQVFTWQVMLATAVFSMVLNVFSSPDLEFKNIPIRILMSSLSVIPMFFVIWGFHQIPVRGTSGKIAIVLTGYFFAGALRGATLAFLLSLSGISEGGGLAFRLPASAISMSVTVGIATYFWTTYVSYQDAVAELFAETKKLQGVLEKLGEESKAEVLGQISNISVQILEELRKVELFPAGEQTLRLQKLIDELVRPLSVEFAQGVQSFVPEVDTSKSSRSKIIFSRLDWVSSLPSLWFSIALGLTPFPTAFSAFGLETALQVSLYSIACLVPVMYLGFWLARWLVPKLRGIVKVLFLTLLFEVIAIAGVLGTYLALLDQARPTTYIIGGLVSIPLYAWFLAIGGSIFSDLRSKTESLQLVNQDLIWAIARVNLLAWFNRGVVSRLLHGPIQNAMHATLIRLKNRDPEIIVDNVLQELSLRILEVDPESKSSLHKPADSAKLLLDVSKLWQGVAEVTITQSARAASALESDLPAGAIVADVCNEICSNSIRHGQATKIDIQVEYDSRLIKLSVADDGSEPESRGSLGLGTRFLDSCSVSWSNSRTNGVNQLVIALPCTEPVPALV